MQAEGLGWTRRKNNVFIALGSFDIFLYSLRCRNIHSHYLLHFVRHVRNCYSFFSAVVRSSNKEL